MAVLARSLIGNIWQIKIQGIKRNKKEKQDFPQSHMSVFNITENHNVLRERMALPLDFREHGVSVGGCAGGGGGGTWSRAQKENQVAKAAERDTRSTESAGSRDPAAPLPLPQSSNKLPWMLRFFDSFLSLSHISFAPSWQSVRAVTVQLWKSSQYLERNRTKAEEAGSFGALEDPRSAPWVTAPLPTSQGSSPPHPHPASPFLDLFLAR